MCGWFKKLHNKHDKKVTEKILFGTGQLTRTDNKLTLENIKFSLSSCKNLTKI